MIRSKPDENLLKYVNDNFEEYFDLMMEQCQSIIIDDEESALEILNNESIDIERKKRYIKYLKTELKHINAVKDETLWPSLLECCIVCYSTNNILEYFFRSWKGMDEYLISFINDGSQSIKFSSGEIKQAHEQEGLDKFISSVVKCGMLTNQKYQRIVKDLGFRYQQFSLQEISSDKIKILIVLGIINMNKDNLLFMRTHYDENLLDFIIAKQEEYVDIAIDVETFVHDELLKLLTVGEFSVENKMKLLEYANQPISIIDITISDSIKMQILQHNFMVDDLPTLVKNFNMESQEVQNEIAKLGKNNLEWLIEQQKCILPFEILTLLLNDDETTNENKIQLLANSLSELDIEQAKSCFSILDMQDFIDLLEKKRNPSIDNISSFRQLLTILDEKEWISSYKLSEDEKSFRVYSKK